MPLKSKQPRMEPLSPPYDEEAGAALDLLGPSPIQLFRVWARRPELARSIANWGSFYFSRRSALTLRQRELVIDRTTALCGARYEWAVHVTSFADKAGLDAAQLDSLATGKPADACWDATDRAVLEAVDELPGTFDLTDETWASLTAVANEDVALELTLLCGWYHAISFAVRALRLPPEPGTESIAALIGAAADGTEPGKQAPATASTAL
ncbi:carboxymuconolactone decarboxylase family protein [Streptomyces sp. H39-S7]|uniref:carboxymuconolactone decarboxylase family protein n=1 Tax=Streptomyces sp. H39-S7 TaxID=3004357 RepID=UPI0022AEA819|nr:carboxymuconolactone decarboxylase family protein [Streptomyces sp. H39-S7]MCZ4122747.1 carboxymuconolactone decarboxylase family protein [Streptomyces sp. H39-S7]